MKAWSSLKPGAGARLGTHYSLQLCFSLSSRPPLAQSVKEQRTETDVGVRLAALASVRRPPTTQSLLTGPQVRGAST